MQADGLHTFSEVSIEIHINIYTLRVTPIKCFGSEGCFHLSPKWLSALRPLVACGQSCFAAVLTRPPSTCCATPQSPTLVGRPRLAARLRSSEMRILSATMDAVRRRLAPIRGIPTKSGGMTDPNADIAEMFDFIEDLPRKPGKLLAGLARWASGADDPDWNK